MRTKILIVIFLVFIVFASRCKEDIPEQAKPKEEIGIDISGKNEEERIQEALHVINEFLDAVHGDDLEKAYNCITPEYYNLLSLEVFKQCVNKENFIKEVKREHYRFNNFDDWKSKGDRVWFEIPKELLPRIYFNFSYRGEVWRKKSHEVVMWLEDKNWKYFATPNIIVGCIRLSKTRRSEWKIEDICLTGGMGLWERRAEEVLFHRKLL